LAYLVSLSYGLCKFPMGYLKPKPVIRTLQDSLLQFEAAEAEYRASLKRLGVLSAVG
jgi:hypothetical protein